MLPLKLVLTPARLSFARGGRALLWVGAWLAAGAILTGLVYQVPARHSLQIGANDAGYVQGWDEPVNAWGVVTDRTGVTTPYRWTTPDAALLFPQIGLPASITLRWRAWRPPGVAPPHVSVLLNGRDELGSFQATGDWEEHTFAISGGLWKPRDLFVSFAVDPPWTDGGVARGIQVDQVTLATSSWPIVPYPAQLLGGALATVLAALVFLRRTRLLIAMICAGMVGFVFCYRLALSPVPLRLYWPVLSGLYLAALIVREAEWGLWPSTLPRIAQRVIWRARTLDGLAGATIALWSLATWWVGRAHVVLAMPGVEKDFRVFATRSDLLKCPPGVNLEAGCVLRADGFYQLGYPFLLWLVRVTVIDNAFLAARIVALLSGTLLLVAAYFLGRTLYGHGVGLLVLFLLVLNRWTSEYSLSLGTDMPFIAAWSLALLALMTVRQSPVRALLAGLVCGLAFLIRHPGILLLPLGCGLLLWPEPWEPDDPVISFPVISYRQALLAVMLILGFIITALPQLIVNIDMTDRPFYSQQAKNIWLAVYGNTDWNRWGEAANDVTLRAVIAHDPGRFVANWWSNIRAFVGTGSEDTSEFGRGIALRLLSFPANLLAGVGLALWLFRGDRRERWLLLTAAAYVAAVSVGFLLDRFMLPLLPIWALAAGAAAQRVWAIGARDPLRGLPLRRLVVAASIAILVLLFVSPWAGGRSVLARQTPESIAVVALVSREVTGADRVVAQLPSGDFTARYSAIAHLVVPSDTPDARFLLRVVADGEAPPAGYVLQGRSGRYALYRLGP